MVAVRIRERQRLSVENRIGLMDYAMMIWTYYHQIIVVVIPREDELDNMVDLDNPLIVMLSEVFATDLTPKIIECL